MPFRWDSQEHVRLGWYVIRGVVIATPIAAVIGSSCALFLWALDQATETRFSYPWLLFLLPLAGVLIVWSYRRWGGDSGRGNNLIMDEIHEPRAGVPARMAPMILISTLVTHLFGGSAGREGTAIQIGGSLAATLGRFFKLTTTDTRKLLMVGMSAGFAGVFGTPLAGTVFAIEVLAIGRMTYEALLPCLIGAIVGDYFCTVWGVHHTRCMVEVGPAVFEWLTASKVAVAAVAFGLVSVVFAELTHGLHRLWERICPQDWFRPVIGGCLIIGLTHLLGTRDYLGLGVYSSSPDGVSILNAFHPGGADAMSWWWKILFTAITLSSGFKGGEVTPLFFIGATLGNTMAGVTGAPADLFAALGFVAVFAGATNTPLACTLMGIELFGSAHMIYFAIACFLSYVFSGHSGIYLSQRIGTRKGMLDGVPEGVTLARLRDTHHSQSESDRSG